MTLQTYLNAGNEVVIHGKMKQSQKLSMKPISSYHSLHSRAWYKLIQVWYEYHKWLLETHNDIEVCSLGNQKCLAKYQINPTSERKKIIGLPNYISNKKNPQNITKNLPNANILIQLLQ